MIQSINDKLHKTESFKLPRKVYRKGICWKNKYVMHNHTRMSSPDWLVTFKIWNRVLPTITKRKLPIKLDLFCYLIVFSKSIQNYWYSQRFIDAWVVFSIFIQCFSLFIFIYWSFGIFFKTLFKIIIKI